MSMTKCETYTRLLAAVEKDEQKSPGMHDYRGKLAWIVARAQHYANKLSLTAEQVLDAWESRRDYWYMNYYQERNQPNLEGQRARVFETQEALNAAITTAEFRCPACAGVSNSPYECTASDDCDWKVYGLFGDLGKGIFVFVKTELRGERIFLPLEWESDTKAAPSAALAG